MTNNAREIARSTEEQILNICHEICRITGVQLGDNQRKMVLSRLLRRANSIGIPELDSYVQYYRMNKAAENAALVSVLTTHHTAFFREAGHFQYLETTGLQGIISNARSRGSKKLRILSAACSRGHECYTLAMLLAHQLPKLAPDFTFEIVGIDIDQESIAIAKNGVYFRDEIKVVPIQYLANHWTRGTKEVSAYVKANTSLQSSCSFVVDNLLDMKQTPESEKFDIVFCRNVFIYFTQQQIEATAANLLRRMHPNGLFFVGMSESLAQIDLPLSICGPSIYKCTLRKPAPTPAAEAPMTEFQGNELKSMVSQNTKPIRVLCVDDSPVILMILKKILTERNGFRVVATATNGIEATAALANHQVDVITLDIHMPQQDGLTYLRNNYSSNHPPVVILSSVSRDDSDLAHNCFKAGASDYVEKPSMGEIEERAEEICIKLRCAVFAKGIGAPTINPIDATFATKEVIADVSDKARIMLANFSDRERLVGSLAELSGDQPATFVVIEGMGNPIKSMIKEFSHQLKRTVETYDDSTEIQNGSIYLCDAGSLDRLALRLGLRTVSILIYGEATAKSVNALARFQKRHVIAEENYHRQANCTVLTIATDVVPATSFAYLSNHFLARRG